MGDRPGQPRRARARGSRELRPRPLRRRARRHGGPARSARRGEVAGRRPGEGGRGSARLGVRLRRRRVSPSPPRRTSSAPAGTRATRHGSPRRASGHVADDLEPGDLRRAPDPRRRSVPGRGPPRAGRRRARLPRPRVRGTDKLYVPTDAVGMVARYLGGESPRRDADGGVRLGPGDRQGEARRQATWPASSSGSTRCGWRCPGARSVRTRRGSASSRTRSRYEETPDQLRPIDEVKRDMERPMPMDRLLCGDVGFGKTEVAVRAAFKAVMDGQAGRGARADHPARRAALRDVQRAVPPVPREGARCCRGSCRRRSRSGVVADVAAGQRRRRDRHPPAARRGRRRSRTSDCWSSTRSSGSASRTRSG